jgi:hypothetical protein
MNILLELPVILTFLIVGSVSALLATLGLKLVRKKYTAEMMKEHHEVAGFIFNAFGLIYAVLVAFVVFATWTDFDDTKKNIELEASCLSDLFFDSEGFPEPLRTSIQSAIIEYTETVISEEWSFLARDERSPAGLKVTQKLWGAYLSADVKSLPNVPIYQESLKRLNNLGEYRRLRVLSAVNTIPFAIWLVLVLGAVISVAYTYFFGTKNLTAQYIMTAVFSFMTGLVLFLIYILDHPFTGYNRIKPEAFEIVLDLFKKIIG